MAEKLFICYRPCVGRTERKCVVLVDREGNLKDKRSVSPQLHINTATLFVQFTRSSSET